MPAIMRGSKLNESKSIIGFPYRSNCKPRHTLGQSASYGQPGYAWYACFASNNSVLICRFTSSTVKPADAPHSWHKLSWIRCNKSASVLLNGLRQPCAVKSRTTSHKTCNEP